MGLAVFVGILVDVAESDPDMLDELRSDFARTKGLLAENGLPTHEEPEQASWEPLSFDMYGYSGLHYLRRIAAHLAAARPLPPPGDDSASSDPVQEAYYDAVIGKSRLFRRSPKFDRRFDHLLVHSDAEAVGIPPDLDPESEELWAASDEQGAGEGWRRYGVESFTCVRLLTAARESVRRGAAVVFN